MEVAMMVWNAGYSSGCGGGGEGSKMGSNIGDEGNGNGGAGDEGCVGDGVKVERAPAVVMLSIVNACPATRHALTTPPVP